MKYQTKVDATDSKTENMPPGRSQRGRAWYQYDIISSQTKKKLQRKYSYSQLSTQLSFPLFLCLPKPTPNASHTAGTWYNHNPYRCRVHIVSHDVTHIFVIKQLRAWKLCFCIINGALEVDRDRALYLDLAHRCRKCTMSCQRLEG